MNPKPGYDPSNPHIWTHTGKKFHILNPAPEEICVEDIAHALSLLCRYTGHTCEHYSVAQHSILVSEMVKNLNDQKWALFHDASEAYLGDVSGPLKCCLPQYMEIESAVMETISRKFGLCLSMPKTVKAIDKVIQEVEMASFLQQPRKWTLIGWYPSDAKEAFLNRFHELFEGKTYYPV